ncbi:acetyl-CoA carboxylase carboxyltransferase subunit alpha/beta [Aeromicrobium sp. Leaf350]|uniref:acetyl-CoA carboxylase carboxyltransferase subunit alpha/beta n=1 Tax=Aeromicrobium sp. Leaf350 TaxID=2876565 RepID=UPI001E30A412|nr:acetyl-CoA carboxylase carboxyltransferase subunit alpha/beta [Aeromicrobium sp. Leaf350]
MAERVSARDLIGRVLDEGSFESWDSPIDRSGYSDQYRAELERAEERSGSDESVLTGRGTVSGRQVAFVVNEFGFLAGSIGRDTAARIVAAVRRATAEGLPILASTASGGTRMQEGTPAFVRMVDISRAIMDHRAAGLPYLVHLRHPTTGGVFASWGSLGHVTVAEPGALVGFLGPKVYELLNGRPFPPGVQVSENLADRGIIDAVVKVEDLPAVVEQALGILLDPVTDSSRERREGEVTGAHDTWASIEITRGRERAGVRDLLRHGSDTTLRLQGTDEGERDSAMLVVLARLDGVPCVVIGQDRTTQTPESPMGPAALREARRGMRLANELGLPLVSVIDTPGAELSAEAEQGSIAGEIARCIATMSTMRVPTVSVLLGEGCGGGALALLPADVTLATEHAWLSPLPPEGASAIVHGDVEHAAQMAEQQRVSVLELREEGTVHHVLPEPAGDTPAALATAMAAEIGHHLRRLTAAG